MPSPRRAFSPWQFCAIVYCLFATLNVAIQFPYDTDRQEPQNHAKAAAEFYRQAYAASAAPTKAEQEQEEIYVRLGEKAAEIFDIAGRVRRFATQYGLENKRVLDIGAGRGYLQDIVENYVGLDISVSAQRYFHKPFVLASATAMPFPDNSFDGVWSIWVMEHVPNPESALAEIRRVVKPGGVIFLLPAWFTPTWASQGYDVRPYSDFGIGGKLIKASRGIRSSGWYMASYTLPIRALRLIASKTGPTSFHYTRLVPNYKKYWEADSDAVNSLDPYEMALWFESRGDRCLNCLGGLKDVTLAPQEIVIQVGAKNGVARASSQDRNGA